MRLTLNPEAGTAMIEIRYTLTRGDYREANRLLHLNSTFSRKLNYYLLGRFGFVTGVVLILPFVAQWLLNLHGSASGSGEVISVVSAGLAGLGVVCLFSPWTYRRKTAKCFKEMKLSGERVTTVSEAGISSARSDGTAEGRMAWSALERCAESATMFVLLPNKRQFIPIPKRAMTEQQREFRALLAAYLPGGAAPPATQPALS